MKNVEENGILYKIEIPSLFGGKKHFSSWRDIELFLARETDILYKKALTLSVYYNDKYIGSYYPISKSTRLRKPIFMRGLDFDDAVKIAIENGACFAAVNEYYIFFIDESVETRLLNIRDTGRIKTRAGDYVSVCSYCKKSDLKNYNKQLNGAIHSASGTAKHNTGESDWDEDLDGF